MRALLGRFVARSFQARVSPLVDVLLSLVIVLPCMVLAAWLFGSTIGVFVGGVLGSPLAILALDRIAARSATHEAPKH